MDASHHGPGAEVPLCVDLDGTLLKSDMLLETLAAALKRAPWLAVALPFWLLRGRAALKRELALRGEVDVAALPYDEALLARLRGEHAAGRPVWLVTATDRLVAERIADHLGVFTGVMASDGVHNLKAQAKARALVERFGERGFDYAGEDRHDVPVWNRAREAIVVKRERAGVGAWLRGMRAYQWAKNLLVFVPLATAHRLLDAAAFGAASLAFAAFCLAASAVYLVNDLLDLQDDRRHPMKRHRALAAGEMPIAAALVLLPLLLTGTALACAALPARVGALLATYLAANLAYSLWLKRAALVDVFVLAGLYTLRILAGAAAIAVPVSHWLLAFSLFAFLSIALVKRYVEVGNVAAREEAHVRGRGYGPRDGPVLAMLGIGCACLSALVFALYITSPQVVTLYRKPALLWFAVPLLLYGLSRTWLLAVRGDLHEDPLLFAMRDPASYATGLLVAGVMIAAT
ncbi:MAG TPA: UbiA family prenyltransferase [Usitatibacter sp.]|nr:UbiA family prenyltransferase [Usitatibacter sp.]